jgi:hypothetical protein
LTLCIRGKSRMRECRTYGSERGVLGDQHPYRDSLEVILNICLFLLLSDVLISEEIIYLRAGIVRGHAGEQSAREAQGGSNASPESEGAF